MTGKEYMSEIRQTVREIRFLNEQIERYTIIATEVRSAIFPADRVQTSRSGDRMIMNISKITQAKEALKERIAKLQAYEEEARQFLLQLKKDHERLLVYKYFDDLSVANIAINLNYNESYVYELHKKALDELTAVLKRSGK